MHHIVTEIDIFSSCTVERLAFPLSGDTLRIMTVHMTETTVPKQTKASPQQTPAFCLSTQDEALFQEMLVVLVWHK